VVTHLLQHSTTDPEVMWEEMKKKLQLIHDSKWSSPEYTPDISKLDFKKMFSTDTDLTLV
jgi:hypothetical protein